MKKIKMAVVCVASALVAACGTAGTSGSSSTGSVLGGILGTITNGTSVVNAISSVIGLDKVTAQTLVGSWKYAGPGCAFTSENLLAKAGGEVAASEIEGKLLPYYQQIGISASNTYVTFGQDQTFSAKIAGTPFSGTYTFDEASQQIKLKGMLMSINCYTKREVNGISILFEGKKLLTLLQTMAAMSGNTNLQTIGDISKNYDGVRLGFDMQK